MTPMTPTVPPDFGNCHIHRLAGAIARAAFDEVPISLVTWNDLQPVLLQVAPRSSLSRFRRSVRW